MESVSTTQLAAEYPTLAALPREDLVALADADASAPNEALLEATVRTLPNVSEEDDEHLALLEQVEHAAARNEARRSELETLRDETRRAFVYARTLETQWPGVERALREANKRFTPFAMQSRLQLAANQLHEESEELANSYVEGLSAIDDSAFVRQYREMRTRHHVRSMLHEQCVNHRVQWHT